MLRSIGPWPGARERTDFGRYPTLTWINRRSREAQQRRMPPKRRLPVDGRQQTALTGRAGQLTSVGVFQIADHRAKKPTGFTASGSAVVKSDGQW